MKHGQNLFLFKDRVVRHFGGKLLKGNAKVARPLSTKNAIHLVIKSEQATGKKSMLSPQNSRAVDQIIRKHAEKNGIRIYHFVNVGNHCHLVIRLLSPSLPAARSCFKRFIRSISGLIARQILGAERGADAARGFWAARPFTRIISWGRDYRHVARYMDKNRAQAGGLFHDWGFTITDLDAITWLEKE